MIVASDNPAAGAGQDQNRATWLLAGRKREQPFGI